MEKAKLAVVRVKGDFGISADIRMTFRLLRLYKKNYCVVLTLRPEVVGMIQKLKDHVTFGELDKDIFVKLLRARGKIAGDKQLTEDYLKAKASADLVKFAEEFYELKKDLKDVPGLKPFFRLKPPIGGFERAGIKHSYAQGGALGYRGKDINKLIVRMM